MTMGMKAAGDNPLGWRVAAALCGALTLAAVYLWALLLLRDSRLASFAAGLTLFNNFLFVMSPVGMMDAFLMVFLMWSLVAYSAAIALDLSVGRRRFLFCCSGVLIGLAGACKWNAIDTLAALVLVSWHYYGWHAACLRIPSRLFPALHNPFNKSAYDSATRLARWAHNVLHSDVLAVMPDSPSAFRRS